MLRRKSAEDRKSEIVEAVLGLADQIGPDRLTTNDIARRVGVTQAAIFRHFPTKAALWSEVGQTITARLSAAWAEALTENATPQDRLRGLIAAQLHQIESAPALPAILHSRELNVENADLRDRFRANVFQYQSHLTAALSAMAEEGGLPPDIRPEDAAMLLTSLVQGIAIRWGLGARNFSLQAEGVRLLEVQLALFRHGAGP